MLWGGEHLSLMVKAAKSAPSPKKSLKSDHTPEQSSKRSRENACHMAASPITGFHLHLYNDKGSIQGDCQYLLSKSCFCHSCQVQSRCYSDSVMVLF